MVQKYETRIISFEELSDRDGRQYTVYNIRVQVINEIGQQKQQQSSSPSSSSMITNSWTLRKRYKHFSHLYRSLKDHYPQVGQYKFPNKSVFHTFSQFTKERRRSGFEEFLNLVMSIRPLPPEMEDFLEVDDHYLPTEMKDDGTISQALNNESTIRLKKSIVSSENLDKESFHGKRIPNDNILPTSFSASLISNEDKIREKIKKQMFFVIMSSYIASTLFYAFLIYTSFVDITSTTTDRIVLTMLSLGATVSLVRLSKMKKENKL